MTSIIKAIQVANFKGFSEKVRIEIRPITLLFGANSAGKSSVLQGLQLVREILERGDANVDRTRQGGDTIDLGGFRNFVHKRDLSREVTLRVEMELGDEAIPEFFEDAIEDRSDVDAEVWRFHETLDLVRNQVQRVAVQLTLSWSEFQQRAVVSGYQVDFNDTWCVDVKTDASGSRPQLRLNASHPIFFADEIEGDALFSELAAWARPGMPGHLFRAELGMCTDELEEGDIKEPIPNSVLLAALEVVRGSYADSPNPGYATWLRDFQAALPALDKPILIPAGRPETASNVFVLQEFSAFMSWLLLGPAQLLRDQLRKSRYLGPLRRIPPRDFDVALSKTEAAWSDGMAAWQALMADQGNLASACGDWMRHPQKLATGYGVERNVVQEFDVSGPEPKPLGRERQRLALVDADGQRHLPQDVGVGISQVLPVVVAAQDRSASLVIIEQPELHIHPAVQVGLGDLFIDGVLNKGLSFLIETHSEHLVMRLQRRLREQMAGEASPETEPLEPKDVSFVYLGRDQSGCVRASHIGLTEQGKFDAPWPNGFFAERAAEVLPSAMRAQLEARLKGAAK
ncbi:AAA family ATPase [Paracidovorax anthurii]|uniref:Putative AbiEii toxin of type IV toxin-antitoxin system n=1 Tax=Paracidovorax anthurii TaxID=78229 RepID=A0A328ZAV0_9BURK|nr:AAA family ATPase [Paracidovorax anthurii]RAR79416.1 putative AbiEii toxin of type IV toxin-antitoxin system [Paracidovorax anthurii]